MVQGSEEVARRRAEVRIIALWGEMDALGPIDIICCFRCCEEARVRFFRPLGCLRHGRPSGPVIVVATCDFLAAIVYPAALIAPLRGGAPSRSSFAAYCDIRGATDEGRVYAHASARAVRVDYKAGESTDLPATALPATALPDSLRRRLPEAETSASAESR